MNIDIYSICYNEQTILPYFIRHYKQFARNIIVYDNISNDNSILIMQEAGIDVISFDTNGIYSENVQVDIRNNCWKNSDADWVIVCDMDEFIYHNDLVKYLKETNNTHAFARGYEMMSECIPTSEAQIYDEIKMGYAVDEFMSYNIYPGWKSNYSKGCIFKPSEIKDINFGLGSHYCNPTGNVKTNVKVLPSQEGQKYPIIEDDLKLLHYKYLSREHVINKNRSMRQSENFLEVEVNRQYDAWLPFCKNVIN